MQIAADRLMWAAVTDPRSPSKDPIPPATAAKPPAAANQRKSSYHVSAAVMLSRVLGLVREIVFSSLFGGTRAYECFIAAFRAPNLLRDLFAEGALSTAFVTTFSKTRDRDGVDAAWALARKVLTLTAIFMGILTLAGIVFAPQIMAAMTSGFSPEEQALATRLARVMFPFILLVSLAALAMGMLNSCRVFFLPALASCFFNLGSVFVGGLVAWWMDPDFGPLALVGMAIGVVAGGLFQWLVQLPALRQQGFRFRPDFRWRDPGVRKVLQLMGPAVIAGSAVQVNVMVNTSFASHLAEGSMVWLNNAFRLMQFPLGVFGVAVGTVALPELARMAAANNFSAFGKRIGEGLRLVLFLNVPSAIGLAVLADPLMALLYEHGRFGPHDRAMAASALQAYAFGLLGYSALKVLAPAFYAIDRRNLPMYVSFLSIGVNAGLNAWFIYGMHWGHKALAGSTALVATLNFLILYALLRRHVGSLDTRRGIRELARILLATALMGGLCQASWSVSSSWYLASPLILQALWTGLVVLVAAAFFFAACTWFGVEEARVVWSGIQKKLGSRRTG